MWGPGGSAGLFGVTPPARDLVRGGSCAAHERAKLRRRTCAVVFRTSETKFGEEPGPRMRSEAQVLVCQHPLDGRCLLRHHELKCYGY